MDKTETDPIVQKQKTEEFLSKYQALMEQYNLIPKLTIDFPLYKVLPVSVQLALEVIKEYKGKLVHVWMPKEENQDAG